MAVIPLLYFELPDVSVETIEAFAFGFKPYGAIFQAIKEAMGNEKVEFDLERKSSAARKSELKAVKEYVLQRRPKPKSLVTVASLYWKAKPKEATWSLSDVRELCPVGAPIWLHRDSRQGRWQMEYKRVGSKSASWGIWDGEDNSVKEIVKFAWIYHQQANPDLKSTNENCKYFLQEIIGQELSSNPSWSS
jgi:hypothetical protein